MRRPHFGSRIVRAFGFDVVACTGGVWMPARDTACATPARRSLSTAAGIAIALVQGAKIGIVWWTLPRQQTERVYLTVPGGRLADAGVVLACSQLPDKVSIVPRLHDVRFGFRLCKSAAFDSRDVPSRTPDRSP
jgi:hypothetical protein